MCEKNFIFYPIRNWFEIHSKITVATNWNLFPKFDQFFFQIIQKISHFFQQSWSGWFKNEKSSYGSILDPIWKNFQIFFRKIAKFDQFCQKILQKLQNFVKFGKISNIYWKNSKKLCQLCKVFFKKISKCFKWRNWRRPISGTDSATSIRHFWIMILIMA